jgi:formate dehydrogenase subunit gamma
MTTEADGLSVDEPSADERRAYEPSADERSADGVLVRFDALTRIVHWTTTVLGSVVLLTGTILYVDELSTKIGRRELLKTLHVWCSWLLLVPLCVGVLLSGPGRRLRADLADLGRWTKADRRWLRRSTRTTPLGKFNGGQKLAAALFAGLFVMQLLTGSLMLWNKPFSDSWRTGATFVHDWGYLAFVVLVVGHVVKAVREPELLESMIRGTVPRSYAERERPGWATAQLRRQSDKET